MLHQQKRKKCEVCLLKGLGRCKVKRQEGSVIMKLILALTRPSALPGSALAGSVSQAGAAKWQELPSLPLKLLAQPPSF